MRTKFFAALLVLLACGFAAAPKAKHIAVLKVGSTPAGAKIEVNRDYLGNTPMSRTFEHGTYLVAVSKEGYETAYATVALQSDETVAPVLKPVCGICVLKTEPAGMDVVTQDNVLLGKTPLLCTSLPLGRHRLTISGVGVRAKTVEVNLSDRVPQHLSYDMTTDSGMLDVRSEPSGLEVRVNGTVRGSTPCSVNNVKGEAVVEIVAEGFEPFRRKVFLSPGEKQQLDAVLTALPGGLKVVSIPSGARVYVDDEYQGDSDLVISKVAGGERRVRVEKKGFETMARTVKIEKAKEQTEEFRLQSNTGGLAVSTSPAGATVFIDGKRVGVTTASSDGGMVSESLTIPAVAAGEHELKITAKGYADAVQKITIERDKVVTSQAVLIRRFIPNYQVVTRTSTIKGVLVHMNDDEIRLELRPGVMTSIPKHEVREHGELNE